MALPRYLLLTLLAGCLWLGCSEKSVCQQACEKKNACASALSCASGDTACQWAKQNQTDCSSITTCAGTDKSTAQQQLSCTLDKYCMDCTGGDASTQSDIDCHRPPGISECFAPPSKYSGQYWACTGCGTCGSGTSRLPACNLATNDCRYFATGCIPKSYSSCLNPVGDSLNALCAYCFQSDAGPEQPYCNRLQMDSGTLLDQGH